MVELVTEGWSSGAVHVADSFGTRFRGLVPVPRHGLLLTARYVHGIGLLEPLAVVALDADGRVVRTGWLPLLGLWGHGRGCWILELPWWRDRPPLGSRLTIIDRGP